MLGKREHDLEETVGGYRECGACGRVVPPGATPFPDCPGPKDERSELGRGSGPTPISDRRDEKRERRGVYGPLCDATRGMECLVDGCHQPSDPAHVRSVGAGFGDFIWTGDRWRSNVANLCRSHHREYDGDVGGGSGTAFERKYGVDVGRWADTNGAAWMASKGLDPSARMHPYEQLRRAG